MIRFTTHALAMLVERNLDVNWILRTLERPQADEADPLRPERRRAFAPVPERDGRVLRVVYEPDGDDSVVITAFLDRRRAR
ncbi:MAG TPA: DUF4258 domain-containing protein [Methylomirabilota bacterium]|nr:DUF4258 domain-containing protein [Methylomirabilota bacterium]